MSRAVLKFKGIMTPVCTAFNKDQTLNVAVVDKYAAYIKSEGVNGVLVAGTTGEGPSMKVSERKLLMDNWSKAAQDHKLTLMVQIGGAPIADVFDLAQHAEKLKVDAVLCLPELYLKPKSELQLVSYLSKVAENCSKIPFLYYHIPRNTLIDLDMATLCNEAESSIPNFCGIKFTSPNLDQGSACIKEGRSVFLGSNTLLAAAGVLGFDSAILSISNAYPKLCLEILENIKSGNIANARKAQEFLTKSTDCITKQGDGNFLRGLKLELNNKHINGLNLGQCRNIF